MFKCGQCGKQVGPRVPAATVVTERRSHIFPFRRDANRFMRMGKWEYRNDNGGTGEQIAREIKVGPCCVNV